MGLRSLLGLGSSSSSGESGSGTSTRTSGMSAGWHRTDAKTALRHHREAQIPAVEAGSDRHGRRVMSADPYSRPDSDTRRNFGRPYRQDDGGVQ
ncbi:hypothetical protein [Kitasatospora sp. NPDC096204]|uniref:hypothetical protein n=1 Tax=Kitasatospora sp. NPDC096204 TaxID=3364094 RepID=UPI0038292282